MKLKQLAFFTALLPGTAVHAALPPCIDAQYGNRHIQSHRIEIDAPTIAEEGSVVPVTIKRVGPTPPDTYVRQLRFYNEFRNEPVASYSLSPAIMAAGISTRLRLRESSMVYAVAELSNGQLLSGERFVKVTIGGCGGGDTRQAEGEVPRACHRK